MAIILIVRVPSRPSRPKTISIPSVRRKLCARRRRPASARGFLGQPVLSLDTPSALRSAPARKRSAAVPVQDLRSAMISRTQAATGLAWISVRRGRLGPPRRPVDRNHASADERHPDFRFDVRQEAGNPRRSVGVPINKRRISGRKISVKPQGRPR
jgi:hypothetical protein